MCEIPWLVTVPSSEKNGTKLYSTKFRRRHIMNINSQTQMVPPKKGLHWRFFYKYGDF